jgi:hypothetical protein
VGNPVLQSFAVPLNQKARFSADGEAFGVSWAEIP